MDRENSTKRIVPAMNGDTGAYDETRIGGKLIIEDGAEVVGMPSGGGYPFVDINAYFDSGEETFTVTSDTSYEDALALAKERKLLAILKMTDDEGLAASYIPSTIEVSLNAQGQAVGIQISFCAETVIKFVYWQESGITITFVEDNE